jgi:S-DNA-T family DNA segregation ATPase FtsK/SpoIIIE
MPHPTSPPTRRVALPRPPELPQPHRFPIIAAVAPVIASLVLWAVTHSALTLAFAALGPVIAVATSADARLQHRRAKRRESVRFASDLHRARRAVESAHDDERRELERSWPSPQEALSDLERDPERWRLKVGEAALLRVGAGSVCSGVKLDGPLSDGSDVDVEAALAALRSLAASVDRAPVCVTASGGIGFAGPRHFVQAAARAVILRLVSAVSPSAGRLDGVGKLDADAPWAATLPHAGAGAGELRFSPIGPGDSHPIRIATAATPTGLPRELSVVVEIDAAGEAAITRAPEALALGPVRLDYVSREAAAAAAITLAACARREGIQRASSLPDSVDWSRVNQRDRPPGLGLGLGCEIGVGQDAPVSIDLVTDGPHAIVGGTTGSGKSELLLSWVLSMAAVRSPEEVTFLFVDFKGGAAFDPLRRLPHCVGVITDLDAVESLRALASLGAELRSRERRLASAGLRSIDDASVDETDAILPFPRLVIVVDEYAALLETHAELHSAFSDIAARGRSLGVHLILCTQRPAGVVRDNILANCAIRLSLRVASVADSIAVMGTDAAAVLPARPLGRVCLSIAGEVPRLLQVARSSPTDLDGVVVRWQGAARPSSPWLPPLARTIPLPHQVPTLLLPFGVADHPAEQRQDVAHYDPRAHGPLLVVGAGGTGKSGVLAALSAAPSLLARESVAPGVPALWDVVGQLRPRDKPVVLLIDDLDLTLAACQDEYQQTLLEFLTRLLREGPGMGTTAVITVQRVTSQLHSLAALCGSTLYLRMPSRAEYAAAGGDGGSFDPHLPPGGAHWRGTRLQVFTADGTTAGRRQAPPDSADGATAVAVNPATVERLAVVSTSPHRFADALRDAVGSRRVTVLGERRPGDPQLEVSLGGSPDILIADPDTWQAHWTLVSAIRRTHQLLFDGCSLAEVRALTRLRDLPPPFNRGERPMWLLSPEGEFSRARLGVSPPPASGG